MQCPVYANEGEEIFKKLENECPNVTKLLKENSSMTFVWIMGRDIESISALEQSTKMEVCGTAISNMYMKCLRSRVGVGQYPTTDMNLSSPSVKK